MSEPTIEDVVGQDYWCRLYGSRQHSQVVLSCVDAVQTALRAVLRELERITNGHGAVDIAVSTVSLENRIRAALGEET